MTRDGKIDITYSAGWLIGRMPSLDDSTGEERIVPGLNCRIRISTIACYHSRGQGIIGFLLQGINAVDELMSVEMVGSLETVDKIMKRVNLTEVQDSGGKKDVLLGERDARLIAGAEKLSSK